MNIPAINQNDYGSAFCLASCYLAIIQYKGYNKTMADLINENVVASNGYVNGTGGYFTRGTYSTYDAAGVKAAIDNNNPVIIAGYSGTGIQHYVVAYDYSGSTIYVMDPFGGVFGALGSTTISSWSNYAICT